MSDHLKALEAGWGHLAAGAFSAQDLGVRRSLDLTERLHEAYLPHIHASVRAVAQGYAHAEARGLLDPGDEVFPGAYRSVAIARAEQAAWAALQQVMEARPVTPVTDRPLAQGDPCAVALNAARAAAQAYFLAHLPSADRAAWLVARAGLLSDLATGLDGAPPEVAEAMLVGAGPWLASS